MRKGISAEYIPIIIFFVVIGILFLVTFLFSYFAEVGGPPAAPTDVIKYYDDLMKGEVNGQKVTATAAVLAFFIPLLACFSISWALIRILPVFREPTNRPAAAVLAFGISLYATPTMAWLIVSVFPSVLGISAIFIAIAFAAASLFIMLSVFFWFRGISRYRTATPTGELPVISRPSLPYPSPPKSSGNLPPRVKEALRRVIDRLRNLAG